MSMTIKGGGKTSLYNYTQPTDFIHWGNESVTGLQLSFWQNYIFGQRHKHTETFSHNEVPTTEQSEPFTTAPTQ